MKRPDPAVLRLIAFVGTLVLGLTVLVVFRDIFQPLLIGLLIAYLFDPAVSWLERRGVSRALGVLLMFSMLVVGAVVIVLVVLPTIAAQAQSLADSMPEYGHRVQEALEPRLARLQSRYPEQLEKLSQNIQDGIRANLSRIAGAAFWIVESTLGSMLGALLFVLSLIFVPVFAFYLLVDFPKAKRGMADLIPLPYREVTLARLGEVDAVISSFLRGQLTIGLILACINGIGLLLIGVPLGLLIGILAGLANMVPYMSLVVGLLPALLLGWAEFGASGRLLAVVGLFAGSQLLEGAVLSPRILAASINLHPVFVLLAVIAGGNLFGLFGMLLAVPVAAATQVFLQHWIKAYKQSHIYGAQPVDRGPEAEAAGSERIAAASISSLPQAGPTPPTILDAQSPVPAEASAIADSPSPRPGGASESSSPDPTQPARIQLSPLLPVAPTPDTTAP